MTTKRLNTERTIDVVIMRRLDKGNRQFKLNVLLATLVRRNLSNRKIIRFSCYKLAVFYVLTFEKKSYKL